MPAYVALEEVLLVVDADGTTRRRLERHHLECLAVHPTDQSVVVCGTFDAGLQRSLDGGETFERVGAETLPEAVMSLSFSPDDPEELWVGTEPSRMFRSPDTGETFHHCPGLTELPSAEAWSFPPRPQTHHVRCIEPDQTDPDRLYLGIEAGALVRSHDRGATWEDRPSSARRDNHEIVTHPDAPDRAWAAAGDGYAETRDGGDTWQTPQAGLDHRYCWSVAVDPADPEAVLLASATGPRSAHRAATAESFLYRRRGEVPWERLTDVSIPTGGGVLRSVLRAGRDGGECYAANNRGLYHTADFGSSWERVPADWTDYEDQTVRGLEVV
jgi:hypothetical protein